MIVQRGKREKHPRQCNQKHGPTYENFNKAGIYRKHGTTFIGQSVGSHFLGQSRIENKGG